MKIGFGVLTWDRDERVSNRYGSVALVTAPYDSEDVCTRDLALSEMAGLVGERVRLWAVVTETRKSGHIGDLFLGVEPSTPEVGEAIELGVGLFALERSSWDISTPNIVLVPGDDRAELWMDPRKLYRAHDQTVELHAEVTDADFTPKAELECEDPGCVSTGEADGSLQNKKIADPRRVCPVPERIGDGLFVIDGTPERGKRFIVNPGEEPN